MGFDWKKILILMIPALIIGVGLILSSNDHLRAIASVPVILAWIIYYTWVYVDKRKTK